MMVLINNVLAGLCCVVLSALCTGLPSSPGNFIDQEYGFNVRKEERGPLIFCFICL